jgi:hypothetical protein
MGVGAFEPLHLERVNVGVALVFQPFHRKSPVSVSAFVSQPSGKPALTKPKHYKSKPNHIKLFTTIDMNADFLYFHETIYV